MPRSRVWMFVVILGLYLTLRGYHSRDGDQAYRLPILLHQQDPTILADDPFVRAFDTFNPHSGYLGLLDWTSRVTGLSGALLFWFVLTFAATAIGFDRVVRSLWPDLPDWVGPAGVGLLLSLKAGNIGTNHLFEATLLDRLMGFALGWLALSECLARPDRAWWSGGVLLGLAGWIHPTVGLQLALTLSATWVLWAWLDGPDSRRRTILAVLALGLGQVPNLIRSVSQSSALFEGLPTEDFRLLTAWLQSPQHMLPSTWRRLQWLGWFGCVALGGISLARIGLPPRDPHLPPPTARVRFACLVVVNLASLLAGYLAIEWLGHLKVTVFQPFRMATLARGLALAALAGRIAELGVTGGVWNRLRATLIVAGVFGDGLMFAVAVFEVTVSLARGRWAVGLGLASLGWGIWYLSRHDTESGHLVLLAAVPLGCLWGRLGSFGRIPSRRALAALTVAAWVVPIAALIGPAVLPADSPWLERLASRCRFWAVPSDDVERLAVWCRENTPRSARFIGPPGPKTFRLWSERSLAFNRSASPYAARGLADWAARYFDHVGHRGTIAEFVRAYLDGRHDLERNYDRLNDLELADLARRQGADHVLAASKREAGRAVEPDRPLTLLQIEGRYAVYRVR